MTDLQELRADLACALRWAVRYDLHEGVCNHFSVAVPDDDGVVRGNLFEAALLKTCVISDDFRERFLQRNSGLGSPYPFKTVAAQYSQFLRN